MQNEMKELYRALASFQQEVPVIEKGTDGYGYKYADLPTILEKINPLLKKHGLGFYQTITGTSLKTVIFHVESGREIVSLTEMPLDSISYEEATDKEGRIKVILRGFEGMNRVQAIGSMITYFRRYALSTILGLVTDTDPDGTSATKGKDGEEITNTKSRI